MKRLTFLSLIILSACASQPQTYEHYLQSKGLETQRPESFQHCHGYGCKFISRVNFTAEDWKDIKNTFNPAPKTSEQERDAIKRAIALFEQKAGQQAGTHSDQWGTFRKIGNHQHDCVDESTNTTIYLDLLHQYGLLTHHRVESPSARFPLIHSGRWPHQSAVISEITTSRFFAVDSWFHDNGAPPEIVSLKQWKEGWKPDRDDDSPDNP